jgi:hypothetical protein
MLSSKTALRRYVGCPSAPKTLPNPNGRRATSGARQIENNQEVTLMRAPNAILPASPVARMPSGGPCCTCFPARCEQPVFPHGTQGKFEVEVRMHDCVAFRGIIGIQDEQPF